jgi:hypothetical protein
MYNIFVVNMYFLLYRPVTVRLKEFCFVRLNSHCGDHEEYFVIHGVTSQKIVLFRSLLYELFRFFRTFFQRFFFAHVLPE